MNTIRQVRVLAYQMAKRYSLQVPKSWEITQSDGEDWFGAFIKRNPTISLRTPEATSIARATNFNMKMVDLFFNNYLTVTKENNFLPCDIYNMDETGLTTVQRPNKVIARKGEKQVGAITTSERGTLMTLAISVNALGNSIPPMFIYPRKKFYDHYLRDGPVGCIGVSNGSGWMLAEDFIYFLNHFIKYTKPSQDKKVLLILDNHKSHQSIEVIELCSDSGIVLLTLPPHCTHKLQPLDRTVFGPLKKYYNSALDAWMRMHPEKSFTIYDIPGVVKNVLPKVTSASNIQKGFESSGIWPLNSLIFNEENYNPLYYNNNNNDPNENLNLPEIIS
ncbi:uncharacterized protein LOC135923598 [Gordionus sp. m RMFG-2023]|uniref:uncharacterized protein LOC135923598 n=1 Tax=Gordionus sp. m RMFG-2023 TaxID=3053472 RepID=UPI0031FD7603